MSTGDDGGLAFPGQPTYQTPHGAIGVTAQNGMTLRDYFAGQAVTGILPVYVAASVESIEAVAERVGYKGSLFGLVAREAYALADAMLAERSK